MKQAHNVRVRVTAGSRTIVEAALAHAEALARRTPDETFEKTVREDDGIVQGQLWLDHQQPVRQFIRCLRDELGPNACKTIAENPTKHLDTATHCFLHLERAAFCDGKSVLVTGGDSVSIRINIAAFPATKENAAELLAAIFSGSEI